MAFAAQLRVPGSNILQVGYEHDLVRAFDDITVHYESPEIDETYQDITVDLFQVKYQVRQGNEFTWEALMDPSFINASAVSILQRLRDGVAELTARGVRGRFTILAPRPPGGELRLLLTNAADAIDMSRLFDHTTNTERATIRGAWREHLGLSTDSELRSILEPLRIRQTPSLEQLRRDADIRLAEAGLRRWPGTERASRYDDLPKKLVQSGISALDRQAFERLATREGLIAGPPIPRGQPPQRVRIVSFSKHSDQLAGTADRVFSLLEHFDGRGLRPGNLWEEHVRPGLEQFLMDSCADAAAVDLRLDAHATIAFAAGWHFDLKAHVDIAPVQNGITWRPDRATAVRRDLWEPFLSPVGPGPDIAVCLCLTHDVQAEVREYAAAHLPQVGAILALYPVGGFGQTAVQDGTHAFQLAEAAARHIVHLLPRDRGRPAVHLFVAAPNGFVFFLGRMARRLGEVVFYEYDFERRATTAYMPSLRFQ